MSFQTMKQRLLGEIPGLSVDLAGSLVNEALGRIYDEQMWSFQMCEGGWLTPGLLSVDSGATPSGSGTGAGRFLTQGTITTRAYSDQIVADSSASALWTAYNAAGNMPLLTAFQIRSPYYSLYNIIAYDDAVNAPYGTLTLDRPWMEPAGIGQPYMMYQAYFPAPVADFKRFFAIRDTTNGSYLDYWSLSQRDFAVMDPQRVCFDEPNMVVPYRVDGRVGSATFGWMLFELYPHPLSVLPYTFSYLRRGPPLALNSDTVPYPLTDELVIWRAKEAACLWKEANKGEGQRRDMGTDWRFLAGAAKVEYTACLKTAKDKDRDQFDLYFNRYVRGGALGQDGEPFFNVNWGLNIGGW